MITLTREEAQQVLKVLEYPGPSWPESRTELAVALRYKLAEPEPEPVAWAYRDSSSGNLFGFTAEHYDDEPAKNLVPLYTAPSQREWVGLMGDEWEKTNWSKSFRAGAKWAEAYLKEKNAPYL